MKSLREILLEMINKLSTEKLLKILDICCNSCKSLYFHSNHFGYACKKNPLYKNGSCLQRACIKIEFKELIET